LNRVEAQVLPEVLSGRDALFSNNLRNRDGGIVCESTFSVQGGKNNL
jgi:hypothetical protein